MSGFFWQEAFSVHIKEIDEQHKHWVELINSLNQAIVEKSVKADLVKIFDRVYEFTQLHFSTEEKYFKAFKYEDADSHIEAHRNFLKRVADMQQRLHEDNMFQVSLELSALLELWVANHVLNVDKKYEECFHAHGLR